MNDHAYSQLSLVVSGIHPEHIIGCTVSLVELTFFIERDQLIWMLDEITVHLQRICSEDKNYHQGLDHLYKRSSLVNLVLEIEESRYLDWHCCCVHGLVKNIVEDHVL